MTTRRRPGPPPARSPPRPPRLGRRGWLCVSSRFGRFSGSGTEMILGPVPGAGGPWVGAWVGAGDAVVSAAACGAAVCWAVEAAFCGCGGRRRGGDPRLGGGARGGGGAGGGGGRGGWGGGGG